MPYFVYILKCKDKSLYTGITTDIPRRLAEHKQGVGSNYTRAKVAIKMLYIEQYPTRSLALKRELKIKKMTRIKKLTLIKAKA